MPEQTPDAFIQHMIDDLGCRKRALTYAKASYLVAYDAKYEAYTELEDQLARYRDRRTTT